MVCSGHHEKGGLDLKFFLPRFSLWKSFSRGNVLLTLEVQDPLIFSSGLISMPEFFDIYVSIMRRVAKNT